MQKGGFGRRGEREYYERRISVRSSWTRVGIREGGGTGYARGTPRGMKNRCGGAGTTMAGIRTKWRFLCEGRIPSGDRPGFLPRWNPPNTFTYALGPLKCNSRPRLLRSPTRPPPTLHTSSLRRSLLDKPLICLPFFLAIDLSVFLHPSRRTEPTDKRFEI